MDERQQIQTLLMVAERYIQTARDCINTAKETGEFNLAVDNAINALVEAKELANKRG